MHLLLFLDSARHIRHMFKKFVKTLHKKVFSCKKTKVLEKEEEKETPADGKVPPLSRPLGLHGMNGSRAATSATGTVNAGVVNKVKEPVAEETDKPCRGTESPPSPPEDDRFSTSDALLPPDCPAYAAKAVWGLRYTMEDKWAAVPGLLQVPSYVTSTQSVPAVEEKGSATKLPKWMPCVRGSRGGQGTESLLGPHDSEEGLGSLDTLHYFGVYDGHGGADAAKHCAARLHHHFATALIEVGIGIRPNRTDVAAKEGPQHEETHVSPIENPHSSRVLNGGYAAGHADAGDDTRAVLQGVKGHISSALVKAFLRCDKEFGELSQGTYVGTTAVVAVMSKCQVWVANVGDSRAVLCRNKVAVPLSVDHKASRDDEVVRVRAAGGHVWWDRVMGELAISRAIGDHCLRPYVIPEPEVTVVERCPDDELLVMATDGLWDVLSNQEAVEMALHNFQHSVRTGHSRCHAAKKAASALTKAALERGTRDNVTVLVVDMCPDPVDE